MPRPANRLKLLNTPYLGTGTTATPRGAQGTPFVDYLTDDGASDYTLNEDYSGGAVDAYWTNASRDAVITYMTLVVGDSDVAANTTLSGVARFIGDLNAVTNGLLFRVKDGSGNVVLNLHPSTTNLKTMTDLITFGTDSFLGFYTLSATSTNNYSYLVVYVDMLEKFGGGLVIPAGHRFICTLNDNFSSLSTFTVNISGYFL